MAQCILAIDDDAAILELYKLLLPGEGYEVLVSLRPLEDMQEIERLAPSLAIIDLRFGGQPHGLSFIEKLRTHPPTMDLPIILTTAALAEVKVHEKRLQQVAITILPKPFDIDELLALIQKSVYPSQE